MWFPCRWNATPTCVKQISCPTVGQRCHSTCYFEGKSSPWALNVLLSDSWPQVGVCLCDGLQSSRKRGPTLGLPWWAEPLAGPSTGDHRSKTPEDSSSGHSQVGRRLCDLKSQIGVKVLKKLTAILKKGRNKVHGHSVESHFMKMSHIYVIICPFLHDNLYRSHKTIIFCECKKLSIMYYMNSVMFFNFFDGISLWILSFFREIKENQASKDAV